MLSLMNSFWEVAVDLVDRAEPTGLTLNQKDQLVAGSLKVLAETSGPVFAQAAKSNELHRLVDAARKISQLFQAVGSDPVDDVTFEGIIGHLK